MFDIRDMPPQVDPELLALLARCRTESIGHHRHWGFIHGSIKAVMPERRVVGTAVTVAVPGHDSGMVTHLLGSIRPGDFICIDRLGDTHNACWGGGTTLAARVAGAVGVVIDGPATGSAKFGDYDLPARTRTGRRHQHSGQRRRRGDSARLRGACRRERRDGAAARRGPLSRPHGAGPPGEVIRQSRPNSRRRQSR